MPRSYLDLQRGGPFTMSYLARPVRFSELRNPSHACHMFHPSCRALIVKASLCNQPSDRQRWILLLQNRVCDSVLPGQCYSTFQRAVDGWLWISGGMMISRGKQKKIEEKLAPVPLRPPRIDMKSPGTEPNICDFSRLSYDLPSPLFYHRTSAWGVFFWLYPFQKKAVNTSRFVRWFVFIFFVLCRLCLKWGDVLSVGHDRFVLTHLCAVDRINRVQSLWLIFAD